jgi:hypothetical protein
VNWVSKSFPGFFRYLTLSLAYYVGVLILFYLSLRLFNSEYLLNKDFLLNWDASHYDYIAHVNYTGFRNTFFPLFPFIWKFLKLGPIGIVIFNGLLFIVSSSVLASSLNFSMKSFLLLLSFPTLIFLFLPYAESLFFFSSSFILVGINKQKYGLMFAGLFFAVIARPVGCLFIPVAFVFLLMTQDIPQALKKSVLYVLPVLMGMAAVVLIQYHCTGDWFAFSHAEKQWWGNDPKFPKLHLTSWGGDDIVRLDGSALLIGMVSSVVTIYMLIKRIFENKSGENKPLIFSLLYLSAICWFVLFTRGGSLFSLNRFVYTVPFFFVALVELLKKKWKPIEYLFIFILVNAFWLLLGSYVHIHEVLKYLLLTLFLMSFLLISHPKKYIGVTAFSICLLGNMFLQIYFYYNFLDGCWVG